MLVALALALQVGTDLIGDAPMRLSLGGIATGEVRVRAGRIKLNQRGEHAYSAEIKSPPFRSPLKAGDLVYVNFEARALSSKNESGLGLWNTSMQRGKAPFDGWNYSSGSVGAKWKAFHYGARVDKDYPAGETEFTMHVALAEQELEIRNFRALNLGPDAKEADLPVTKVTYAGSEPNAPWRKKADAMIRQHRMAPLSVTVTKNGKPVRNQPVRIEMLRHAYPFGTFIEYHIVEPKGADSARYLNYVNHRRFSRVTVPIYWSDWGWLKSELGYLETIKWCMDRGIRMKAHNILWPSDKWLPAYVRPLRGDALRTELFTALDQRLARLKGLPFENIDVINELKTERDIEDRLGFGALVDVFKRTRATFPKADLVYNDFAVFEGTGGGGRNFEIMADYTKRLRAAGAPLTLSGWQAHFGDDVTPPERVWNLIDRWKRETGLPLEATEFDVNSRDEQLQADYLRDLLTAWFAHPDTRGFTMWGFWEGSHWIPAAAMFRRDWTAKPAVKVWDDLVTKRWWTDQTLRTDAKGQVRLRGFHGDYRISSGGKSAKAKVEAKGLTLRF